MKFNLHAAIGDRLWVRETWAINDTHPDPSLKAAIYRASMRDPDEDRWTVWRPSIHMPRWASRLTLHVTDLRVQRLQDISEADARAEGCSDQWDVLVTTGPRFTAIDDFEITWDSLNGAKPGRAWRDNPWVVAVTFEPENVNIDQARRP